jgi:hypothetical protein
MSMLMKRIRALEDRITKNEPESDLYQVIVCIKGSAAWRSAIKMQEERRKTGLGKEIRIIEIVVRLHQSSEATLAALQRTMEKELVIR